jgi:hypothetical protein
VGHDDWTYNNFAAGGHNPVSYLLGAIETLSLRLGLAARRYHTEEVES